MAKLSEIIAKREELAKTNPSATNVDARKALMGSVSPAPQANIPTGGTMPIAPQVAPATPTSPVTPVAPNQAPTSGSFGEQTQGMNVDQRRAVRAWVVPPATEGTTTPSGATLTPEGSVVTQTTTEQNTPTEPKKLPEWFTPVFGEDQAKTDAQMALEKQKSDLRQSEVTKANEVKAAEVLKLKQDQEAQLANNEWAILNTLRSGWIVPESVKSSPYYKTAQSTYNKMQQYSNYSTGELVTAMNSGSILPGTSLYNEMMKDPAMKSKLNSANIYRANTPTNQVQIYENKSNEILTDNPTTASMFADGLITQEEYAQATNNDDIKVKAADVETKTNKYNTLYAEYEAIDDKVKADFPWSPFADAIAGDLKKAKYKDVVLAKWEMDSAIGTLTDLKAQSASLFETNLWLYKDRRAEQLKIEAEQRQNQFSRENMFIQNEMTQGNAIFQNKLAQSNAQFQTIWDKVYKVQNGQMTDTGIKAEANTTYQAVGGKLYKIKWDSITDTGISAVTPETPKWTQDATGNWYDAGSPISPVLQSSLWGATWDLRSLASQFPWQAWAKNNNPAGITWNSNFDKWQGTAKLLADAGISYSKGTARPSGEGGNYVTFNTIEDGLKAQQIMMTQTYGNSTVWQMLSSWVWTSEWPNYAKQVAGMAWVDPNVKVSSLSPEQLSTLQMAKIQKESPGLAKLLKSGEKSDWSQYTDSNIELLADIASQEWSVQNTSLKNSGITRQQLADYKAAAAAGKIPPTEGQKQSATQILSNIQDIASMDWNDATWFHWGTPSIVGTDRATAEAKINNLVSAMTLPNLGILKWPMSDKDLAFIQSATSKLALSQSDSEFEKQLIELYNISARKAGLGEITKLNEIPSGRILPWQSQQIVQPQGNTNTWTWQVDSLWIRR